MSFNNLVYWTSIYESKYRIMKWTYLNIKYIEQTENNIIITNNSTSIQYKKHFI